MQVMIPFIAQFKQSMLNGTKLATSRTRQYGKPGDTFTFFGAEFKIISVWKIDLSFIANNFYQVEGCYNPEHFKKIWQTIHPIKGYQPNQLVYFHLFKRAT